MHILTHDDVDFSEMICGNRTRERWQGATVEVHTIDVGALQAKANFTVANLENYASRAELASVENFARFYFDLIFPQVRATRNLQQWNCIYVHVHTF